MARKSNILGMFMFLLLASTARTKASVFDVTSAKYGAKPGGDVTQALTKAWTDACTSATTSKIIVPKGTYRLKEAYFRGPCKAPIEMNVQGILQAPGDGSQLTRKDTWIGFERIDHLTLTGGGVLDGQGQKAWAANDCRNRNGCKPIAINLRLSFITNSVIKYITSQDSKNFHVNVFGCNNVTFDHFHVSAPGNSANTDGIHIGRSTLINIIDTTIKTGDDCVSIGDGSTKITVERVTCGPGHGISIGSLGRYPKEEPVVGIKVKNCTIINTTNGVRIKTWPASPSASTASDMHFEDIIMNHVSNPIILDQKYCPWNQCNAKVPSKVKISNVSFKKIRGTSATALAVQIVCARGLPCENVELADIDLKYGGPGSITSQCANVKPTITNVPAALACATTVA